MSKLGKVVLFDTVVEMTITVTFIGHGTAILTGFCDAVSGITVVAAVQEGNSFLGFAMEVFLGNLNRAVIIRIGNDQLAVVALNGLISPSLNVALFQLACFIV